MSVRNGFAIEIYGFTHSLHTSSARTAHDTITMEVEDSEDTARGLRQYESSCTETVNCSTKDKWMKDNKITATRNDLCVSTRAIYFSDL